MLLKLEAGDVELKELTYGELNKLWSDSEIHSGMHKRSKLYHDAGVLMASGSRDENWINQLKGKDATTFREKVISLLEGTEDDIKN